MTDFGKWWNDPKKHSKRLHHWLPHLQRLAANSGEQRSLRYFTLCARSMIDVFMLVKEDLLQLDPESYSIPFVRFCEYNQEHFAEIKDLIALEDAGFFGRIEEVVLFADSDFTAQFPTPDSIAMALEDKEDLQEDYVNHLLLKRTFLHFASSFPYDVVNLDFCEYYYPNPPDMLRISKTVERLLDWQRRTSEDESSVEVNEFIMAVTCRHDDDFPAEAERRLAALIRENCVRSAVYRDQVEQTRGGVELDEWLRNNKEDFFFSGWPKDIARAARERGWSMDILDYVYYRRVGDREGNPYVIACLIARFSRTDTQPTYLPTALYALNQQNRKLIRDIDRNSPEGRKIYQHLTDIVALRNQQARRMQRPELPIP